MEKPTILLEVEFREKLAFLINEYVTQIPALHIMDVLKDCSNGMAKLSDKQLKEAKENYEREVNNNVGNE